MPVALTLEELDQKLKDVQRNEDGRYLIYLNQEEEVAIRKMIARERAWQALGILGSTVKHFALWIGVMMATYAALKAGILGWLAVNFPLR